MLGKQRGMMVGKVGMLSQEAYSGNKLEYILETCTENLLRTYMQAKEKSNIEKYFFLFHLCNILLELEDLSSNEEHNLFKSILELDQ